VDPEVIAALYRASKAGVEIDLIIRGICCLLPGLPEVSEHIRVVSIIGRFLEHSRIAYFGNGGSAECYIGSADWMPRNFDRRVETMVPIDAPESHARLRSVLEICLADNRQAWVLGSDGQYRRRSPNGEPEFATQQRLIRDPAAMSVGASNRRKRTRPPKD
jgi:polyphosphate kinase